MIPPQIKKRLWLYIKIKRKDNNGVVPLNDGGNIYTDEKYKACVLNEQFQSLFTTDDVLNVAQLDYCVYPSIQHLDYSIHDIEEARSCKGSWP